MTRRVHLSVDNRWIAFSAITAMGLVLSALALTSTANAAFTTAKCGGPDITGRGASFAREAHQIFNPNFKNSFCAGTSGAGVLNVTYDAAGSGAGRLAVKVRNDAPRFGMSDEPPTPNEVLQMNTGVGNGDPATDPNPNDNGQIHVIPAAVGAVAPLVNFPNGCPHALLPDASETLPAPATGSAALTRVRFTKAQFEAIWSGASSADNWTEVFPELAGDTDCNVPITRVVRFDISGTTFAFKDYLDTIDGAEGWLTTYAASDATARDRAWPDAQFGNRDDCGDNDGTAEAADPDGPGGLPDGTPWNDNDLLTSGCSNGNQNLVPKLIATDGSVGYSDIGTARIVGGLAINPAGGDNDTYWTQIPNGSDAFTEPTTDPNGFRIDGATGSNCAETTFTSVPASTFGDWSQVSGVNSPAGYGICTLTYGLVFDDNAPVWGDTAQEEAKARTVKDYWDSIVTPGAQGLLSTKDYSQLPPSLLSIAQAGVASIDWTGTSTGGGDPDPPPPPPPDGGGPPAPPSNQFSILKKEVDSKRGGATIQVRLPGAGGLVMKATAKKPASRVAAKRAKTIKVGGTTVTAAGAGSVNVPLKPSAAAKKVLKREGSLKTKVQLTFTPSGGSAASQTTSVKLKLAG